MCGQSEQKTDGLIRELFSVEGRIDRAEFVRAIVMLFILGLAYVLLAGLLISALMRHTGLDGYRAARTIRDFILYVPVVTPVFCAFVKRLHDINLTGLVAVLMLVPVLRLAIFLMLVFMPGRSGGSRYGPLRVYQWRQWSIET